MRHLRQHVINQSITECHLINQSIECHVIDQSIEDSRESILQIVLASVGLINSSTYQSIQLSTDWWRTKQSTNQSISRPTNQSISPASDQHFIRSILRDRRPEPFDWQAEIDFDELALIHQSFLPSINQWMIDRFVDYRVLFLWKSSLNQPVNQSVNIHLSSNQLINRSMAIRFMRGDFGGKKYSTAPAQSINQSIVWLIGLSCLSFQPISIFDQLINRAIKPTSH